MKYFVSNGYVEKIMDNLKTNNDQIKNKLEGQMEELQEMFTSYTNIREIELPRFGAKIDAMDARQNNLFRWIIKSNLRYRNVITKQKAIKAFKISVAKSQNMKRKIQKLIIICKNFFASGHFSIIFSNTIDQKNDTSKKSCQR